MTACSPHVLACFVPFWRGYTARADGASRHFGTSTEERLHAPWREPTRPGRVPAAAAVSRVNRTARACAVIDLWGVTQPDEGARRLPAGRKAQLAAYVAEVGEASVARLAERFEVSVDTIRRDLDSLDAEGYLIRTHGGAVSVAAPPRSPSSALDVRTRMQAGAKEKIGAAAAALVSDGMVLMVNAGTTTLALARHLARAPRADDRDEQPPAARPRSPRRSCATCTCSAAPCGSRPRRRSARSGSPPGPATADREIQADLAFIGVGSVSEHGGYWTSNLAEAGMLRDMMQRSARVAVLADSTKLGAPALRPDRRAGRRRLPRHRRGPARLDGARPRRGRGRGRRRGLSRSPSWARAGEHLAATPRP